MSARVLPAPERRPNAIAPLASPRGPARRRRLRAMDPAEVPSASLAGFFGWKRLIGRSGAVQSDRLGGADRRPSNRSLEGYDRCGIRGGAGLSEPAGERLHRPVRLAQQFGGVRYEFLALVHLVLQALAGRHGAAHLTRAGPGVAKKTAPSLADGIRRGVWVPKALPITG